MEYYFTYVWISKCSVFVPVIAGAYVYRKMPKSFQWFWYFFLFSTLIEFSSKYISQVYNNTNPIRYLFTFIEFGTYQSLFYILLKQGKHIKTWFLISSIIVILMFIFDILNEGIWKRNDLSRSVYSIVIIINCLLFFYNHIKDEKIYDLKSDERFWYAAVTMVYFGFCFFYFISMQYFQTQQKEIVEYLAIYHLIINFICNLAFGRMFLCYRLASHSQQ